MDQTLGKADSLSTERARPILLDESTVPRGQLLPVCQDPFLSAPFQFVENNWMNQYSAVTHFSPCAFTPPAISHTFPQMGSDPFSTQTSLDISSVQVNPVAFPAVNFAKVCRPAELKSDLNYFDSLVKQSDSPLIDLTDDPADVFPNQPVVPLPQPQSASSSSGDLIGGTETHPVPEVLSKSLVLENDSQCDMVSPLWLDLFWDSNNNLSFPDADLESVLSPESGSA